MDKNKWLIIGLVVLVLLLLLIIFGQNKKIGELEGNNYFWCANTNDLIDLVNNATNVIDTYCGADYELTKLTNINCSKILWGE